MEEHSVLVDGGLAGERISFSYDEDDDACRLTCVARGETFQADESDYFEALRKVRRRFLEPKGIIPLCYGASLNVWPSGMSRDMGRGLKAYKFERGAPATELVYIFDEGQDVVPSLVKQQEDGAQDWFKSLGS